MDRIANTITDHLVRKQRIDERQREIYCYGLKLILADVINFSLIMLLSVLLGRFWDGVAFLITLCGVRKYSGGFHAKTFWLCRLSMLITYLCVIGISELLGRMSGALLVTIVLNVAAIVIIPCLAPVKHPNKILTDKQLEENKLKAAIASEILAAVSILFVIVNNPVGITMAMTLCAIVVLMFVGIISMKGGRKNV